MADRREEKERLRRERLAAQRTRGSSERRRLILGYIAAGVLAAAVLVGLVVVIASGDEEGEGNLPGQAHIEPEIGVFTGLEPDDREGTSPPDIEFGDLEESARRAGCELNLDLPEEGRTHFEDEKRGDRPGAYKTNPPTSGNHFASGETGSGAIADGAYLTKPSNARFVHSMEHGRVLIHYDPELPEDEQLAIKGVFDDKPDGLIMFPNPDQPYAVAVTAWTQMVGCPEYDPLVLDVIRNFRDSYIQQGPENFPISL